MRGCRRAPPRRRVAGHRGVAGGLDRAGQAREGGLPHPQQVQARARPTPPTIGVTVAPCMQLCSRVQAVCWTSQSPPPWLESVLPGAALRRREASAAAVARQSAPEGMAEGDVACVVVRLQRGRDAQGAGRRGLVPGQRQAARARSAARGRALHLRVGAHALGFFSRFPLLFSRGGAVQAGMCRACRELPMSAQIRPPAGVLNPSTSSLVAS